MRIVTGNYEVMPPCEAFKIEGAVRELLRK